MKTKEQKSLIKFLIILAISTIIGYGVGFGAGHLDEKLDTVGITIKQLFYQWLPVAYMGIIIGGSIITLLFYYSCKIQYRKLQQNREDDVAMDRLEEKFNVPVIISSIITILNLFLFASVQVTYESPLALAVFVDRRFGFGIMLALFVLWWVLSIAVQRGIVEMTKEMNPEKQGSIFDMNFQKEWHDSCDEGQQLIIYKSCYTAYKCTIIACIALWLLTMIGATLFRTGILPIFVVCAIWMTTMIGYFVTVTKLEKVKRA